MEIKIGQKIVYCGKELVVSDAHLSEDVTGSVLELRAMDEEKARDEQVSKNDLQLLKTDPVEYIRKVKKIFEKRDDE